MQGKGISWFGRTPFSVTDILKLTKHTMLSLGLITEGFSGPDVEKVVAPTVLEGSNIWWA